MSKTGSRMVKSARQALAYAKGTAETRQYGVHIPERLDVKAIRGKVWMSQEEFARHFGVSKRAVQDREEHRRSPSGPSRAFPVVIDRELEVVRRALAASALAY